MIYYLLAEDFNGGVTWLSVRRNEAASESAMLSISVGVKEIEEACLA